MTLQEIKDAVLLGKEVCCGSDMYRVRFTADDYYIVCLLNRYRIGLTWADGVTLNCKEEDFYIFKN